MTLIWLDGFETSTAPAEQYDAVSGPPSVVAGRNGNAMNLGANGWVAKLVPANGTYVIGAAFFMTAAQGSPIIIFIEGAATHIDIRLSNGGAQPAKLQVTRNGTQLGSNGPTTILFNTWYYIEVKVVVHDTTGSVEVKLNGVTELNLTGQDTRNGGSGVVDRITLQSNNTMYVDDYWVDNSAFHGDCKVEALRPTGAGATTEFDPSAGSNWQNVDDTSPDGDTTYNSSSTPGEIDLFGLGNLVTLAGTVKGIKTVNRWRKDDAGSRMARRVIRTDAANFEGADAAMSDSYLTTAEVIEQNPDTAAAWTIAEVNALEAGYKVQS